jgi:sterol desaturase/sphingolipid hydroxylase (fatty acid hydroxylase superfamily)
MWAVSGVPLLCLAIEASVVGYRKSALHRLLDGGSSSVNDLFYYFLRTTGASAVLIFVLSFGFGYTAADLLRQAFNAALLAGAPYTVQFFALMLVHTFVFYWSHRLMHVDALWEIHKVHHSAEDLNVVTPLRNHPVDGLIMLLVYAGPYAALGVSPFIAAAYLGCNAIYQCLAHSSLSGRSRILELLIITPSAHRMHHSADSDHWGTNYGILTLWDWMFGTYLPPDETPKQLGVGEVRFNTGRPMQEMIAILLRWLRSAASPALSH